MKSMVMMGKPQENGGLMGFYSDSIGYEWDLPSGYVKIQLLEMAIETVSFPINGDFPIAM